MYYAAMHQKIIIEKTSEICGNRYPQIPDYEHYNTELCCLLAVSSKYLNLFSRSKPEMKSAAGSGELE